MLATEVDRVSSTEEIDMYKPKCKWVDENGTTNKINHCEPQTYPTDDIDCRKKTTADTCVAKEEYDMTAGTFKCKWVDTNRNTLEDKTSYCAARNYPNLVTDVNDCKLRSKTTTLFEITGNPDIPNAYDEFDFCEHESEKDSLFNNQTKCVWKKT